MAQNISDAQQASIELMRRLLTASDLAGGRAPAASAHVVGRYAVLRARTHW